MKLLIICLAIAIATGAFVVTKHFVSSKDQALVVEPPQPVVQEIPTVNVYTAREEIGPGTILTEEMLDKQPWPKHLLLPDMVVADPSHPTEIVKMIVRNSFAKGEPIVLKKLANEKDPSFAAAAISEGMRLITINVDASSGGGGNISVGDKVDIIITYSLDIAGVGSASSVPVGASPAIAMRTLGGDSKKPVATVLIPNVRVLATDQPPAAATGGRNVPASTMSLEVAAADAQRIRLAESNGGRLSLTLRSLKEKGVTGIPTPSYMKDLAPNAAGGAIEDSGYVTVIRGVNAESVGVTQP